MPRYKGIFWVTASLALVKGDVTINRNRKLWDLMVKKPVDNGFETTPGEIDNEMVSALSDFSLQPSSLPNKPANLEIDFETDDIDDRGITSKPQYWGDNCGKWQSGNNRIVGGEEIDNIKAPWSAYFHIVDNSEKFQCGAVYIGGRYLLSAATCCQKATDLKKSGILLGEPTVDAEDVEGGDKNWYSIKNFEYFSNDRSNELIDNICLIKLARSVTKRLRVKPICLPTKQECFNEGTILETTGYGVDENDNNGVLKKVSMPLEKLSDCSWIYSNKGASHLNYRQVCAGGVADEGTCDNDQGSALYAVDKVKKVGTLYGINSARAGACGQLMMPTVFARVTSYLDWIKEKTGIFMQSKLFQKSDPSLCKDDKNRFEKNRIYDVEEKYYEPLRAANNVDFKIIAIENGACMIKGFGDKDFNNYMPVVSVETCPEAGLFSEWRHDSDTHMISSKGYQDLFCWSVKEDNPAIFLKHCLGHKNQEWRFDIQNGHIYLSRGDDNSRNLRSKIVHHPKKLGLGIGLKLLRYSPKNFGQYQGSLLDKHHKIRITKGDDKYIRQAQAFIEAGHCIATTYYREKTPVFLESCDASVKKYKLTWKFNDNGQIQNFSPNDKKNHLKWCIKKEPKSGKVFLRQCAAMTAKNERLYKFSWSNEHLQLEMASDASMCLENPYGRALSVNKCPYYVKFGGGKKTNDWVSYTS